MEVPALYAILWLVTVVIMTWILGTVGMRKKGKFFGALIDERNRYSLSRLQLVCWTVLVMSAFLVMALARVFTGIDNALAIAWPEVLLGILGISAGTTVGAQMIKSNKATQTVTTTVTGSPAAKALVGGPLLATNPDAHQASWMDFFLGDEQGDKDSISIGKFQLVVFTLVGIVTYAFAIGGYLYNRQPTNMTTLPPLQSGLLWVLGISGAGYLGQKIPTKPVV